MCGHILWTAHKIIANFENRMDGFVQGCTYDSLGIPQIPDKCPLTASIEISEPSSLTLEAA